MESSGFATNEGGIIETEVKVDSEKNLAYETERMEAFLAEFIEFNTFTQIKKYGSRAQDQEFGFKGPEC